MFYSQLQLPSRSYHGWRSLNKPDPPAHKCTAYLDLKAYQTEPRFCTLMNQTDRVKLASAARRAAGAARRGRLVLPGYISGEDLSLHPLKTHKGTRCSDVLITLNEGKMHGHFCTFHIVYIVGDCIQVQVLWTSLKLVNNDLKLVSDTSLPLLRMRETLRVTWQECFHDVKGSLK